MAVKTSPDQFVYEMSLPGSRICEMMSLPGSISGKNILDWIGLLFPLATSDNAILRSNFFLKHENTEKTHFYRAEL